ncbi:hypothetical protein [Brochothrix thermosphacta]|uniref:hypothetical protein n=1 Tax=Brochothrix thermosphacta TaxID=2756 RepID=UPI000D7B1C5C|nr:hypothetical protein [Brochothrix thermosphacta]SPN76047.1 conserved hypothetical protein [Brochothrix thermosphacta]
MGNFFLGGIIIFTVMITGETFFTIPTENPQRVFFFVGEFVITIVIYSALTAIIDKIKKKNS